MEKAEENNDEMIVLILCDEIQRNKKILCNSSNGDGGRFGKWGSVLGYFNFKRYWSRNIYVK